MGREIYRGSVWELEGRHFGWRDWAIDGLVVVAIIVTAIAVDLFALGPLRPPLDRADIEHAKYGNPPVSRAVPFL